MNNRISSAPLLFLVLGTTAWSAAILTATTPVTLAEPASSGRPQLQLL